MATQSTMFPAAAGDEAKWNFLDDTYWIVPTPYLPAVVLANLGTPHLVPAVDQTVWHITGCRDGYFWGVTAVLSFTAGDDAPTRGPRSKPTPLTLIGTVTPEGTVQITFVPSSSRSSQPTVGVGRIVEHEGQLTFEMQMSTMASNSRLLAHWAYMMQTREGEPSWENLPGVGMSVEKMLAGIDPPENEDD